MPILRLNKSATSIFQNTTATLQSRNSKFICSQLNGWKKLNYKDPKTSGKRAKPLNFFQYLKLQTKHRRVRFHKLKKRVYIFPVLHVRNLQKWLLKTKPGICPHTKPEVLAVLRFTRRTSFLDFIELNKQFSLRLITLSTYSHVICGDRNYREITIVHRRVPFIPCLQITTGTSTRLLLFVTSNLL